MKLKLSIVLANFIGLLNLMTYSQNNTKMESKKAALCFEIKALLGEGAFWDHHQQRLYWVDIEGKKVHLFDPVTKINSLFDTTSSLDMTEEEKTQYPLAGSLFTVNPGVVGVAGNFFTK